jgi:hypothetical protein
MHHTGKPSNDPKSRQGWKSSDFSYAGIGSSELTNWARSVCVLQRIDEETFELKLAKRGKRAEAVDILGNRTNSLWLKHADRGILWEQVSAPEPARKKKDKDPSEPHEKPGRPKEEFNIESFITSLTGEHFTVNKLVEAASEFSELSTSTIKRNWLDQIKGKMKYDDEFKTWTPA